MTKTYTFPIARQVEDMPILEGFIAAVEAAEMGDKTTPLADLLEASYQRGQADEAAGTTTQDS